MNTNSNNPIAGILDLSWQGLKHKPVVFGGLAMEYYGLRKHGDDIDLIVSNDDYMQLAKKYPEYRKDSWGDFGVSLRGYEMFRSVWKLDYGYLLQGAHEYEDYMIISYEKLFLMKVLSKDAGEKYARDLELMIARYLENQNQEYKNYMDAHVDRYLAAPGGFIFNGDYYED